MKPLGLALVALGIVALVYAVIGFNSEKAVIDVGGFKATATTHETNPLLPIVGVVSLVGGVALLYSSKSRT